ncbi:MAG TPA: hypothetical protein VFY73_12360 [Ideonella sp.]|uniref:hypothetical protein n=1 Tax=Ideonella sp. TaxID=1929293 RepID=UPI002E308170|nr:hypothetical protein [Ideonella sp.]HEX5684811.1 hypothetical protein [Ideonella sp.]
MPALTEVQRAAGISTKARVVPSMRFLPVAMIRPFLLMPWASVSSQACAVVRAGLEECEIPSTPPAETKNLLGALEADSA